MSEWPVVPEGPDAVAWAEDMNLDREWADMPADKAFAELQKIVPADVLQDAVSLNYELYTLWCRYTLHARNLSLAD